jgi:hypothetical protein
VRAAQDWMRERLAAEYGVAGGDLWELGGRYFPSPGLTPEVVHPFACEVKAVGAAERTLAFVPLASLVERRQEIFDGHLRTVALRAAHALGVMGGGGS